MSYAARAAAAASLKAPIPPITKTPVVPVEKECRVANKKIIVSQAVSQRAGPSRGGGERGRNDGKPSSVATRPQPHSSGAQKTSHEKQSPKNQPTSQLSETTSEKEEAATQLVNVSSFRTEEQKDKVIADIDLEELNLQKRAQHEATEKGYSLFPEMEIPQDIRLSKKFVYYYHLPNNPDWLNISSYRILHSVETVGQAIMLSRNIPSLSIYHCSMMLMREGVLPMWEHALNRDGGYFSLKVSIADIENVWRQLILQLCGGSIFFNPEFEQKVNGITISPKRQFYIVKIWMVTKEIVNPSLLRCDIHGMHRKTIQSGEHRPEFVL